MKKTLEMIGMTALVAGQIAAVVSALWSYALCFQVNGTGLSGIISFLLTLLIPVVMQVAWAYWAFVHDNPYFWAVLATVTLWGSGFAIMAFAKRKYPTYNL